MSNKLSKFFHDRRCIMGIIGAIFVYLLIPYIDIIMRAIYTVGTIVGTYTRLYS